GRGRCVLGVPRPANRADRAARAARGRARSGAAAARDRSAGRAPARRRAPPRGDRPAAGRDLSSRISAAYADREGKELAGPLHAGTATGIVEQLTKGASG